MVYSKKPKVGGNKSSFYSINIIQLLLLFLVICIIIFLYHKFGNNNGNSNNKNIHKEYTYDKQNITINNNTDGYGYNHYGYPAFDIYTNPYMPPIRDEISGVYVGVGRPPLFNMATNPNVINTTYRQIGILTPQNAKAVGNEKILPFFGRPVQRNQNKWQYYTTTDTNNIIKLSVFRFKKNCMNQYGCDYINNGDVVYVDGYKEQYIVTLYENMNF